MRPLAPTLIGLTVMLTLVPAVTAFAALSRVPPQYRKREPWTSFLLLIPVFSLIWAFFVHPKVADSLRAWAEAARETRRGDCGRSLAVTFCSCSCIAAIPLLGFIAIPVGLFSFVAFYIKAFSISARIGLVVALPPMPPVPRGALPPLPGAPNPPPRASTADPVAAQNVEAQLRKLKEWREQGLISEPEYQKMKQGWLGKLPGTDPS